ncbi:unnamed protein product [Staurois parvus]|uniref:Transposase n=1 Tax=Staurois parvus TaxID=386267 RepID=A0ABN9AZV8_9NEOB|nr:unnamed protein product [Staurois parvus]
MISCHMCNKSICEISLLLNIPQSTVSGIITKWKQLETTAIQPTTALQSSEDVFSGMTNQASLSGNLVDIFGFGGCQ